MFVVLKVVIDMHRSVGTIKLCKIKVRKGSIELGDIERRWWPLPDLNWGPSDYESPALTTELRGQYAQIIGDEFGLV